MALNTDNGYLLYRCRADTCACVYRGGGESRTACPARRGSGGTGWSPQTGARHWTSSLQHGHNTK